MSRAKLSLNKKISNEYEIQWTCEAGLCLQGYQVKCIRNGQINLNNAYGYFVGSSIHMKNLFSAREHESVQLLLHKTEIKRIIGLYSHAKRVIVFREIYDKNGKIKVELCVGERFTKHDHRRKLMEKDIRRQNKYDI